MNKGRPLDQIWTQFEKTNTGKAKCKDCGCEFAALVERMKTHYSKFHAKTAQDDATAPKQRKMEPFVVKTSKSQQEQFDIGVAKFYANNIPFKAVQSDIFKSLVSQLHPGYKPPTRMRISNDLLDTVCGELQDNAKKNTNGKFATFCLDGWSNVANDPIVASSVQVDDIVYIVDIIDTGDQKHTGENLCQIALQHIEKAKENYGIKELLWRHHLLDLKGCSRPWDMCIPIFGIDWIRQESGNLHFA